MSKGQRPHTAEAVPADAEAVVAAPVAAPLPASPPPVEQDVAPDVVSIAKSVLATAEHAMTAHWLVPRMREAGWQPPSGVDPGRLHVVLVEELRKSKDIVFYGSSNPNLCRVWVR